MKINNSSWSGEDSVIAEMMEDQSCMQPEVMAIRHPQYP
jgi:hypothetical protein